MSVLAVFCTVGHDTLDFVGTQPSEEEANLIYLNQ